MQWAKIQKKKCQKTLILASLDIYCTMFQFLDHFVYLRNPKKMAKIETKSIAQCEVSAKKTAN